MPTTGQEARLATLQRGNVVNQPAAKDCIRPTRYSVTIGLKEMTWSRQALQPVEPIELSLVVLYDYVWVGYTHGAGKVSQPMYSASSCHFFDNAMLKNAQRAP